MVGVLVVCSLAEDVRLILERTGESIGLEDVNVLGNILSMTSSGTDTNIDLELGLQPPQRSYNPRERPQILRADGNRDTRISTVSPSTTIPLEALDQDAVVHNTRTFNDEDNAEVFEAHDRPS